MTLTTVPQTTSDFLQLMDHSLPKKIFAQEVEKDIVQLSQLSRVLLSLPADVLQEQRAHFPRLQKALTALLNASLWTDVLMRNPGQLVTSLPLLRLYRRLDGPHQEQAFYPLRRLLDAGFVTHGEWMPPHLLEIEVSLQELGLPHGSVQEALQQTILPLDLPAWVWCYEKTSVLDYLLRVAGSANLPVPASWQGVCEAQLLQALHGTALRPLSTALLNVQLAGQAQNRWIQQAVQHAVTLQPVSSWEAVHSAAEIAVALCRKEF